MLDLLVLITLIFGVFGVMSTVEWLLNAHHRGMERVRRYDARRENN
jgi:hypothetical protein